MVSYNFKRLIKKYSKFPVFLLRESHGFSDPLNGGVWVPGTITEWRFEGAVVPLTNEDLRFDEGGTYNYEDRKLYCYIDIAKGEKVKHKEKIYTILERRDYEDFDSELKIYFMKRSGTD